MTESIDWTMRALRVKAYVKNELDRLLDLPEVSEDDPLAGEINAFRTGQVVALHKVRMMLLSEAESQTIENTRREMFG